MKLSSILRIVILPLCPAANIAAAAPEVQVFFKQHCLDCHDSEAAKGDLSLEALGPDFTDATTAATWNRVLEQLALGQMPPEKKPQPTVELREQVSKWIGSQLVAVGQHPSVHEKLKSPEYGNYVDHQRLFDGSINELAWSPSRLWKRSPHIFDSMVIRGIGLGKGRHNRPNNHLAKVKQPFTMEERAGLRDFAEIAFADSATLGTMMRNAEAIVDKHLTAAMAELLPPIPDDQLPKDKKGKPIRPRHPKSPEEFHRIVVSDKPPSDSQLDAAIGKMFDLVVERTPGDSDTEKYRQLIRDCLPEGGNAEALRIGLIAIAISPGAIYRAELGSGEKDAHGRRMLGPAELAYSIAYALTDDPPDANLLEAAKTGKLANRTDVAREVTRLWDNESIEKPRILRFFHEFFGYTNAPKVFKDTERFKGDYRSVPDKLVEDADTLVKHIVSNDTDVFAQLLTTEKYFVAHSGDNQSESQSNMELAEFFNYMRDKGWEKFPYATPKEHGDKARTISRKFFSHPNGNVVKGWMKYLTRCDENNVNPMPLQNKRDYIQLYNLDEKTFDYPVQQPFVLAKGKRAGILMHPAWLLAHSLNLDNDPVRRGKWIRERLLADTVPELPITVDARIPEDPHQSLRERFSVVRNDSYCWRCHEKMNPLGMPFETFDDFGRHRDGFELLQAKGEKKTVDPSGELVGTGDKQLDGEIDDPIDMLQRIATSKRARQSFVRHAFRYWMGRNEMLSDSQPLMAADQAYTMNGGSFRALIISLLSSDSFIYRKEPTTNEH
ncbi:MAG: hypothetical protein ACI8XO_000977 [Verrucomicrobiales bacterium]